MSVKSYGGMSLVLRHVILVVDCRWSGGAGCTLLIFHFQAKLLPLRSPMAPKVLKSCWVIAKWVEAETADMEVFETFLCWRDQSEIGQQTVACLFIPVRWGTLHRCRRCLEVKSSPFMNSTDFFSWTFLSSLWWWIKENNASQFSSFSFQKC